MTPALPYMPSVKEQKVNWINLKVQWTLESFMNLGSVLSSKQRGVLRSCRIWRTFIGPIDRTRIINKNKQRTVLGKVTPLRGGQESCQSGCLSFPWGTKRAHMTSNLICTDQKITDRSWQDYIPGEGWKLQLGQALNLGFVSWASAQATLFWACGFSP